MNSAPLIASLLIVVGGTFGNFMRYTEVHPEQQVNFEIIPYQSDRFAGVEHRFAELDYELLKADTSTLRLYRTQSGNDLWFFLAYFSSQKYGSQIHSPKHCLPGGGWQIQDLKPFEVNLLSGMNMIINRLVINRQGQKQLMFYWFETRSGIVRSEFSLKWDLMMNSMLLRPTDAAFVRLTINLKQGEDITSATNMVLDFLNDFYQAIDNSLPLNSKNKVVN